MTDSVAWWPLAVTSFTTVFLAELGDKTQLAALGLSTKGGSKWAVFGGASLALVASAGLAVLLGSWLGQKLDPRWTHYGAALLFVGLGIWMFVQGPEGPA